MIPTIEQVKEAYIRNGFKPKPRNVYPNFNKECCALGALADGKAHSTADVHTLLDFPYVSVWYAFGFDRGIVNQNKENLSNSNLTDLEFQEKTAWYDAGYEAGKYFFSNPLEEKV